MSAMAYSPVEQGRLIEDADLAEIAADVGATPTQTALACVMRHPGVIAIPKAGNATHVRENRGAADILLSGDVLTRLDKIFPAPSRRMPLEML
jgi:diketogulonate reductase-like aldo/keto reductase